MRVDAHTFALPLEMAVTSAQAAFTTTDDGGVISMLFDALELRWPAPAGVDASAGPLKAERRLGIIGPPGAVFAIDVRGGCLPDSAAGTGADVEIHHQGGETAVTTLPVSAQIDHRIEGRFNATGRCLIAVRLSLDGSADGGCDRLISINSIDITIL